MTKEIINVGVIGHVDHGKTTLTCAIASVLASKALQETKTIDEIIEEEIGITIVDRHEIPLFNYDVKDGKQSRRERRANERKFNKARK